MMLKILRSKSRRKFVLICSLIHETCSMTLDFHKAHRVLPLAKYIQERKDDVKISEGYHWAGD